MKELVFSMQLVRFEPQKKDYSSKFQTITGETKSLNFDDYRVTVQQNGMFMPRIPSIWYVHAKNSSYKHTFILLNDS